jgi:predicted metal-dependent HD superfamily phosphohydrolase
MRIELVELRDWKDGNGKLIKKFLQQFSLFFARRQKKRYSLRLRQLRLDLIAAEKVLKLSARLSSRLRPHLHFLDQAYLRSF